MTLRPIRRTPCLEPSDNTEYGPGLRCLLSGSQLSHHCTETRRCKQTGVYSVSLHMLMMTREMTSLGLLTTARGISWFGSPQSCGFTCQMINSLSPFTSVLGDAHISCPVTLVPGHGLQRSCRGRTWPTHWLISSTETTNTPEMARGSSLWLSVSTLTGLWLQYRNACHTQLVIKNSYGGNSVREWRSEEFWDQNVIPRSTTLSLVLLSEKSWS